MRLHNSPMAASSNPWEDLPPHAPYVLSSDAGLIDEFHAGQVTVEHRLHLELLPEPFLGRPDAPVVLLNLNPSYSDKDLVHHADPAFAAAARATLVHESQAYPFHLLDPQFACVSGAQWWRGNLSQLLREPDDSRVANGVLCVEYFPYHSESWGWPPRLPSQTYTFGLVASAMERGAVIVILRSKALWTDAVPDLANYPRSFTHRNRRHPWVSQRNCPDGYTAIINAIQADASGH